MFQSIKYDDNGISIYSLFVGYFWYNLFMRIGSVAGFSPEYIENHSSNSKQLKICLSKTRYRVTFCLNKTISSII